MEDFYIMYEMKSFYGLSVFDANFERRFSEIW